MAERYFILVNSQYVILKTLHSIAKYLDLLFARISGAGNGVDPDPAILTAPQLFSQKR